MSDLKKRVAKLEVVALPTMDRFILSIGLPTFKAMQDYLQDFVTEAKTAPRMDNEIDIDFNPPEELKEHFIRWARIDNNKRLVDFYSENVT